MRARPLTNQRLVGCRVWFAFFHTPFALAILVRHGAKPIEVKRNKLGLSKLEQPGKLGLGQTAVTLVLSSCASWRRSPNHAYNKR